MWEGIRLGKLSWWFLAHLLQGPSVVKAEVVGQLWLLLHMLHMLHLLHLLVRKLVRKLMETIAFGTSIRTTCKINIDIERITMCVL